RFPSARCLRLQRRPRPSESRSWRNVTGMSQAGPCQGGRAPLHLAAPRPPVNPTILIVDDEKHTREGLRASLEDNFEVYIAADIKGALNTLDADTIDLMLTDLRLGGEDGMKLIDEVLKRPHPPICIMMTAYGTVDTAV